VKIGELAKISGVPAETIRYYEKIGLLSDPDRNTNGYRTYRTSHLDRLLFIKRCRSLDMAQGEIRELIRLSETPEADCQEVDDLLARHLNHVRDRLKELATLETTLQQLQKACSDAGTVQECGILDGLNTEIEGLKSRNSSHENHVPGTHRPGKA